MNILVIIDTGGWLTTDIEKNQLVLSMDIIITGN